MSLQKDIATYVSVLNTARENAEKYRAHATDALLLDATTVARSNELLGAAVQVAELMLGYCQELASDKELSREERERLGRGLLEGVGKAIWAMYVAMETVEHWARVTGPRDGERAPVGETPGKEGARSCSFCGAASPPATLVAGAVGSICATCVRLACTMLGLEVSERGKIESASPKP